VAAQQVEQLGLQRGARPAGVEVGEKRILRFLEHHRRIEARPEPLGEPGLARAHGPFDGDVTELQAGR
jgi:hypothetical protein